SIADSVPPGCPPSRIPSMFIRSHIVLVARVFAVAALFGSVVAFGTFAADEATIPPGVAVTLKGHTETVYAIAFSPDGQQVATASFDKSVKLWESATGKAIKRFEGPQGQKNV